MNTYETIDILLPLLGIKAPDVLGEHPAALLSRALIHPLNNELVAYVDASGQLRNMEGRSFAVIGSVTLAQVLGGGASAAGAVITNLGAPSSANDAATKGYTDAALLSLRNRTRVRLATTANVTIATGLASGQTVDGVTLAAGDLVLVRSQSAPAQNGIYVTPSSGAASRSVEFDTFAEHAGLLCAVQEGTVNADTMWLCTSNESGTLGTTAVNFAKVGVGLLPENNLADLVNKATARANLQVYAQQRFADAAARAAAVPEFVGQEGYQIDTGRRYYANGTSAGDWTNGLTVHGTISGGFISTDSTLLFSAGGVLQQATAGPFVWDLPPISAALGYINLPQNAQSTAYTTVAADAGKQVLHPGSDNNARTFTIPANASVAYPIGTAITFINLINTVTIAITSDTLTMAGTGGTGSRTLAANGIATAVKVGATQWLINGTGLS